MTYNERATRYEPRHMFRRFVKRSGDYVHNPTPGIQMLPAGVDVFEYHYDRRDEIVEGVEEFVYDKMRMKALFQGAYAYARRRPAKFAAKVITRGVPYVGWALLFYDAYQLYEWYQKPLD